MGTNLAPETSAPTNTLTGLNRDPLPKRNDPFFNKYANKEVPSFAARTQSGFNTYGGVWSEKEILHLLRRTTFGASKANVDILKNYTLTQAVNLLIDNPQLPATTPVNVYQNLYNDQQGCLFGDSWITSPGTNDTDFQCNIFRLSYSFTQWWIGELINQPMHILEKMTLFWANHFGTNYEPNYPKAVWQFYEKIRQNSLGSFRTLIKQVTVDPHMLFFLNGNLNSADAPDENYARELQELFTVGKGPNSTYTENDVQQAAKILTGWRNQALSNGFHTTVFDDTEHNITDKQFSPFYNNTLIHGKAGQDGQQETDELLTMILATDEAAKYICRRLYRWFVYYVIDDATEQNIITPMANLLRGTNYDIAATLKGLFTSEHFFDPLNRGCVIKSPVDLYVGFCREYNIFLPSTPIDDKYNHWNHFNERFEEGDLKIGQFPNVAGWPAYYQTPVYYQAWINSATVKLRTSTFESYTTDNGFPVTGSDKPVKVDFLAYAQLFNSPGDPDLLVGNFCKYLLPQDVTPTQYNYMLNILLNGGQTHYWTDAWNAYIANPSDPEVKDVVYNKLKALIIYITTLEEYQLF